MRFSLILFLACSTVARAQSPGPDSLAYTLPDGYVLHFATAEAKAKYLTAREQRLNAQNQQTAQSASPITCEVSNATHGGQTDYEWRTDYGSHISDRTTSTGVEITLTNRGPVETTVHVRWFFFGGKGQDVVESGEKDVVLRHNQKEVWRQTSAKVFHEENYAAIRKYRSRGEQVTGWMVQFSTGSTKVLRTVGSSSSIEEIARDPKAMESVLRRANMWGG